MLRCEIASPVAARHPDVPVQRWRPLCDRSPRRPASTRPHSCKRCDSCTRGHAKPVAAATGQRQFRQSLRPTGRSTRPFRNGGTLLSFWLLARIVRRFDRWPGEPKEGRGTYQWIGAHQGSTQNAQLPGAFGGLGAAADADLVVDLLQVPLHRSFGHAQLVADFAVKHAGGNHLENVQLAAVQ